MPAFSHYIVCEVESLKKNCSAFKSYHRKPIYRKFFILSGNTSIGSKEVEGVFLIANSMILAIS